MSVESLTKALNHPGVSPAERLVLVGIANHDGDGGAWPSMHTLARYCCVEVRSVQRTMERLVERGLVTVLPQAGGNSDTRPDRRPNRYLLHLDERGDADVAPRGERGDAGDTNGVTPTSPEPSLEPSNTPLPPQSGGTPRQQGTNPRAQGTNPRGPKSKELRNYDVEPEDSEEVAERWGIELDVEEGEAPAWAKKYGPA